MNQQERYSLLVSTAMHLASFLLMHLPGMHYTAHVVKRNNSKRLQQRCVYRKQGYRRESFEGGTSIASLETCAGPDIVNRAYRLPVDQGAVILRCAWFRDTGRLEGKHTAVVDVVKVESLFLSPISADRRLLSSQHLLKGEAAGSVGRACRLDVIFGMNLDVKIWPGEMVVAIRGMIRWYNAQQRPYEVVEIHPMSEFGS